MTDYELVLLLHPDLEIDLDKPLKKVEKILTDNGGKINKQDNWGKRKLAYTIKKQDFAVYVYYEVSLPAEAVAKIDGLLNITDEVLRHLITKHVDVEATTIEDTRDRKKTSKKTSEED